MVLQPGARVPGRVQGRGRPLHAQEDLLRHIFGRLPIAQHPVRQTEDVGKRGLEKHGQGVRVTCAHAFEHVRRYRRPFPGSSGAAAGGGWLRAVGRLCHGYGAPVRVCRDETGN